MSKGMSFVRYMQHFEVFNSKGTINYRIEDSLRVCILAQITAFMEIILVEMENVKGVELCWDD
jgi:hypothetical protein